MNESNASASRLIEVFGEAQGQPAGEARQKFLDEACGGDEQLRAEVERLLSADNEAESFLKVDTEFSAEVEAEFARLKTEEPGDRIGQYKLLEQIGEGGFGTVWLAEQERPVRRKVALKILKPGMDSRQVLARFEAERQALAIMDHPNIATVLDGGATPSGRPYFVMELVKGEPITGYCDQRKLTPQARLELFAQVCHAVQHAHQKGIIHRDIKPSNILVAMHDTVPVVKVIDFGIAKALGPELTDITLFTGFAQLIGTPLYMSPEQAGQSAIDVDTRSDIYSLGVLLYELLTGTTPFDKERFKRAAQDEIRRIVREEEPPKPSTRLSESKDSLPSISAQRHMEPAKLTKLVRGELDWIVMKALEKDRGRRYQTASGFALDVRRYLANEAVLACPPSVGYRLRKFVRRNKGALAATAVVLLLLILLAIGIGWTVRDRADRQARVSGKVATILTEVEQLQRDQKWPQALAALRRAEAAMAGGGADAATGQQVRDGIRDLELLAVLERIQMWRITWHEGKFDYAGAAEDYATAFRDYGVDAGQLPAAELIDRLKTRPAIAIPLAAALDDWARAHREAKDDAGAQRLVSVARGIDPEPTRDLIRSTWGKPASEAADELRRLAETIDVRTQHVATLLTLAGRLREAELSEPALRLLRETQMVYPQDFLINFNLALLLHERKDYEGAVRYNTATVSARPDAVTALNNLGISLLKMGKPAEAAAACRRAIELDPKFANAHDTLGTALSDLNDVPGALASHRKALEIDPKYAAAHGNLGFLYANKLKDYEKAMASYHKALELNPNSADVHNNLGNALLAQGKRDEAVTRYRKAIELAPKDAKLYFNLGLVLGRQKKLDEALKVVRMAVELDPKNGDYFFTLAQVLNGHGKPDEAIAAHQKAIELNPKDAKAHSCVGEILLRQGKPGEAVTALRRAVELDAGHAVAHANLGIVLGDLGDYEGAIRHCRAAIELKPDVADAHFNLGDLLSRRGEVDAAVAAYRKAIELDPKIAAYYVNLGIVLSGKLADHDAAIECQRTAIRLDPENANAHSNLGIELGRQGKQEESLAAHQKALTINPELARSCLEAAWILATAADFRLRDPREAIVLAGKAVQSNPADGVSHACLGIAHYRTGDWKAAITALEKSLQCANGSDTGGWFFLAMAHWQLGNKAEARRWYDKSAEWSKSLEGKNEELNRFQKEAADLLGVKK